VNKVNYKVGLIGATADISDAHLDAIKNNPSFSLKGVCDINEEKLLEKFEYVKDVIITTDYTTLLKDDEINVIVICTPNHLHASMSIDSLKYKKFVLCEKPMTISIEQSKEVLNVMQKSPGILVTSYHFEFFPEVEYLKSELNKFGSLKRFSFRSSEHLLPGKEWNYKKNSGGVWLDWAPNALSVLRKIIAQNDQFTSFKIFEAELSSSLGLEIETNVYVKLLFNKIEGELHIDWEAKKGDFIAETTFGDSNNTEIRLDHSTNRIFVNNKMVWTGTDLRYREVYNDFLKRIESKKSNIQYALFNSTLIESVKNF
jgi:predicted dehydrogenase